MRQAGDSSQEETLTFSYWITVLGLLKIGIAWEAINEFTDEEINLVLGIQAALSQRESDEQARAMARGQMPQM